MYKLLIEPGDKKLAAVAAATIFAEPPPVANAAIAASVTLFVADPSAVQTGTTLAPTALAAGKLLMVTLATCHLRKTQSVRRRIKT